MVLDETLKTSLRGGKADAAIQKLLLMAMDCFAWLAMTYET